MGLGALSGALASQALMGQFLVQTLNQSVQANLQQTTAMIQMNLKNLSEAAAVRPDGLGANLDVTG